MSKPLLVGITGGIGAGKSTLSNIIRALGYPVYDADSRAKLLMHESESLITSIKDQFGDESYLSDGSLNRDFLASRVFNSEQELAKLNALVHPAVRNDFSEYAQQQNTDMVFKEAALLFEGGGYKQLDATILVTASVETRVKRVLLRDSFRSKEELLAIMSKQMPEQEKRDLADFVINNEEKDSLLDQWETVFNRLST